MRDELGNRMKYFYEAIPKTKLMRRTPVAIRLDGKSFHTFTRGFRRPLDKILSQSMRDTMKHLCENIQGCVLGYTQSDEITLILCDYQTLDTCAWFDYEVQKMCSISASMATRAFEKAFRQNIESYITNFKNNVDEEYVARLKKAIDNIDNAMFDSRCFNIPKEEVANLLYWRELDCMRNSVSMMARCYFSDKELFKKSTHDKINMLLEKGHDYYKETPLYYQRGSCCLKAIDRVNRNNFVSPWYIDNEIPVFKEDGREYIERRIRFDKCNNKGENV